MEGPECRFRREARARGDIDIAAADSVKALDLNGRLEKQTSSTCTSAELAFDVGCVETTAREERAELLSQLCCLDVVGQRFCFSN